jgi:hypothetical protein
MVLNWTEVEKTNNGVTVEIFSPETNIPIDKQARAEMIAIQNTILSVYRGIPVSLLIDISVFNLISTNTSDVLKSSFIKDLLALSHEFAVVIPHSGLRIVELIVNSLKSFDRKALLKIQLIHDREKALEKVRALGSQTTKK